MALSQQIPPNKHYLTNFLRPKKGHSRIQNMSQKTSHFTLFKKYMRMQESICAKYGVNIAILPPC